MTAGFAVLAVAGRDPTDGTVSVLRQEVVRSQPKADRQDNMRLFADRAAALATEVVTAARENEAMGPSAEHANNDDGNNQSSSGSSSSSSSSSDDDQYHPPPQPSRALLLDRATHLRSDPEALAALERDPARVWYVILKGNQILVQSTGAPDKLALLNGDEMKEWTQNRETRKTFLGILSEKPKRAVFGIDLLDDDKSGDDDWTSRSTSSSNNNSLSFVDTRTTAPLFGAIENELALHATALAQWQRRTPRCSLCGGTTEFVDAGTACQCTQCRARSWPRQDPSIICAVASRDGARVLLARSPRHPPRLHTVLAGFVEAGETFEAAVAREVLEETGAVVDEGSVRYVGSQPWPFPQSCMIGFTATADDTTPLTIDEKEIVSAGWFPRSEVARAAQVEGATMQKAVAQAAVEKDPSLPLLIPPKGVIARRLIDLWLEDPNSNNSNR